MASQDLLHRHLPSGLRGVRQAFGRRRRLATAVKAARAKTPSLNVEISPADDMFAWANPVQYFGAGQFLVRKLHDSMAAAGTGEPERILDLGCGYGRVMRHMRAAWPDAEIIACELVPEAVAFCAQTFSAQPLVSKEPLWEVDLGERYDLIWAGSLFTHFDVDHWQPILRQCAAALSERGCFVFSTAGRPTYEFLQGSDEFPAIRKSVHPTLGLRPDGAKRLVEAVRSVGFGYDHYPDAPNDPYGVAVALPDWVQHQVETSGLKVVVHDEAGWGGNQDLWTTIRERYE